MSSLQGFVCGPRLYEFSGWRFEWPAYGGPWPVRQDGELYARAGRCFWRMIAQFQALPEAERAQYRVGGGCVPLVAS